jgi:hypothetical protein
MTKTVYFVHCVDTEGPLYESLEATFTRLNERFGLDYTPSIHILNKLRAGEMRLDGIEQAVSEFVASGQFNYNDTWDKIYEMHDELNKTEFRNQLVDSFGGGYVFNWFVMDWVEVNNNPRKRTTGFHAIYDEYVKLLYPIDRIHFHFHPSSFSGDAHRTGCNISYSNLHNEILARRIIDRGWFPVAHRPTVAEHMDMNLWLEQWIPFDFANQNMEDNVGMDLQERCGRVAGRTVDWRGAPTKWGIYNPSIYDAREEGWLRRYIARCLNVNCRHGQVTDDELEKAFRNAENGFDVLVSFTNHDFRDMVTETTEFINTVKKISKIYPDVKFKWCNAVEAMRAVTRMENRKPPTFTLWFEENILSVKSNKELWGPQPFLAIKTKDGRYLHDNFIINSETDWTYVFDNDNILIEDVEKIGVASNDKLGNTVVAVCDLRFPNEWVVNYHNLEDWIGDEK